MRLASLARAISALFLSCALMLPNIANAAEPIRIGCSMALTGGVRRSASRSWRRSRSGGTTSTPRAGCSAGRSSSSTTTTRAIPRTCRRSIRS